MCLYPRAWQARYGEELRQLLLDDLAAGEWSAWWWLDVAWHGLAARLREEGPAGAFGDGPRLSRATGLLCAAVVACGVVGMAMWSQLAVGWQWSAPASARTRVAVELIAGGLVGLGVIALSLAGVRLAAIVRSLPVRAGSQLPLWPPMVSACCVVVLVLGSGWVGLTWPGTGGHAWAQRALMPAWLARRTWALTLWISSFWVHPRQLAALRPIQVGWMVLTPVVMVLLVWSWRRFASAVGAWSPPRTLVLVAAVTASVCMLAVVFGAAAWTLQGAAGPDGLFASGVIDLGLLVAVVAAAIGSVQVARRILLAAVVTGAK